ncbi:hypothetical protein RvY_10781 [Ramazzottius varieornatus]|uniref:Uncharacterized protein n=1 Tax=Ramazzottius varieornatus TaxID=947166 RepID=A0A1D1VFY6_RAMVA|nr:hypothetical protein RvY_10781 [Ramazzottius varieornatus]
MPRRKQEAFTDAPAAENSVTGGRPKRACTQRHVPQFRAQPDVSQPTRLSFSDLLVNRAWPAGYFGFGTTFSAADCRNPRVTLDGWKERTFKDLIRHCARRNLILQEKTPLAYGSAFLSCGSHRSKRRIHRLGSSGMIGTDNCRTMHRFSIVDGILNLRKLYSRDTTAPETVKLRHFSNSLFFVNRNNDDKASFDDEFAEADWKSPLNCSDLLLTTEATAMKESVIRIASLETGKALRIIWLSSTTSFK